MFARAFHQALVSDTTHSVILPFVLMIPWYALDGLIPQPGTEEWDASFVPLWAASTLGALVTTLIVGAMLRVRMAAAARGVRQPALESYAQAMGRALPLLVTEIARTIAVCAALVFFILPGVILGFRLSVAAEAVVLHEANMGRAFQRSFALTAHRLGSWIKMMAATVLAWLVLLVLAGMVLAGVMLLEAEIPGSWVVAPLLAPLIAVVQYAWTLFYLELRREHEVATAPVRVEPPAPPPAPTPWPEGIPPPQQPFSQQGGNVEPA
jgi:hypothetical protein